MSNDAPTNGTDQSQRRPTTHVVVQATCQGYPLTIDLDLPLDKLPAALKRLAALGIEPPAPQESADWRWTPGSDEVPALPICPRHNAVMMKHSKQGDSWYAHKVVDSSGQERWCRGCRNPSDKTDGWLVD